MAGLRTPERYRDRCSSTVLYDLTVVLLNALLGQRLKSLLSNGPRDWRNKNFFDGILLTIADAVLILETGKSCLRVREKVEGRGNHGTCGFGIVRLICGRVMRNGEEKVTFGITALSELILTSTMSTV